MSVVVENGSTRRESESDAENHDPQFEPVVTLPEIEVSTNEENEEEMIKLRAKLYRFDTTDRNYPEWKERGTGEVKLLRHKENHAVRVVMRRDKTLKICANHFITPWMELKPSYGSNKAWVWTVSADFADETAKSECLAIRFATPEIATQWKNKFEEAKTSIAENCELYKDMNTSSRSSNDSVLSEVSDDQDDKENKNELDTTNEEPPKQQNNTDDEKVIAKMAELNVTK